MKGKNLLLAGGLVLLLTIPAAAQRRGGARGFGVVTPAGSFGNVGPYGGSYGTGNSFNNFGVPYSSSYGFNGYGYNGYNTSPGVYGYNNFGNARFNNQWQSVPGTTTWQSGYTPNMRAMPSMATTTTGVRQASATTAMGLAITDLKDSSTAKDAGLRRGDVILSVDGKRTQTFDELRAVLTGVDKKDMKVEFIDGSNGQTETKKVAVRDSKMGVTVEETAVNR